MRQSGFPARFFIRLRRPQQEALRWARIPNEIEAHALTKPRIELPCTAAARFGFALSIVTELGVHRFGITDSESNDCNAPSGPASFRPF